jgi:hypothetical protein
VSAFFRRAEEILQIATANQGGLGDTVVVLDRQGGFRMLEPAGWSLPALAAEFGAEAVYKVERRGSAVRVEGWNGSERCLLQGQTSDGRVRTLLGMPLANQAAMRQVRGLLAA